MPTPENLKDEQEAAVAGLPPAKAEANDAVSPLGGLFTRSWDGWGIDPNWLNQIAVNDDSVLALEGYAPDLKLFDALLDDDVAMSAFQQRRLDVISREWEVEPGADDAQSKAAADHLRAQLKRIGWDDVCDKMLHARWYGYAVAEAMWQIGDDGKLELKNIFVPNRAWFGFRNDGRLVLRTQDNPDGEDVPARKFWHFRCGGSHDGLLYGVGLGHWVYWPIYFKKNVLKFWALFLEKFGMPTVLGKFPPGWETDSTKISNLLNALAAIGQDAAVAIPQDAEVTTLEGSRSSSGASSYAEFIGVLNTALTRIILTQTMTSTAEAAGLGSGQAQVHEAKGLAIAKADADLLNESFNNSIARWLTEWNFPGATPPRVFRKLEDSEDLNATADRDTKLDALGWERTEESVKETYGEGYQRKAAPVGGNVPPSAQTPFVRPEVPGKPDSRSVGLISAFSARDPQPLYIQRRLVNGGDLLAWARAQGFRNLSPRDELHATVLYCEAPVDWFRLSSEAFWTSEAVTIEAGGPRAVEPLGDNGVIVLHFASWELESRHRALIAEGATHGHATYMPHVTFALDAEGVDLATVEPYRGKLEFGPEIWEPIETSKPLVLDLPVAEFAAAEVDAIDRLVNALGENSGKVFADLLAPIGAAVAGMDAKTDPDTLRIALLEALEKMPTERLAEVLSPAFVAVRAAEGAGLGADAVA